MKEGDRSQHHQEVAEVHSRWCKPADLAGSDRQGCHGIAHAQPLDPKDRDAEDVDRDQDMNETRDHCQHDLPTTLSRLETPGGDGSPRDQHGPPDRAGREHSAVGRHGGHLHRGQDDHQRSDRCRVESLRADDHQDPTAEPEHGERSGHPPDEESLGRHGSKGRITTAAPAIAATATGGANHDARGRTRAVNPIFASAPAPNPPYAVLTEVRADTAGRASRLSRSRTW